MTKINLAMAVIDAGMGGDAQLKQFAISTMEKMLKLESKSLFGPSEEEIKEILDLAEEGLPELKRRIATVYCEHFTQNELEDLYEVFMLPGYRLLTKALPELTEDLQKVGLQWGEEMAEGMKSK